MGFDDPDFSKAFWPGFWGNCLADVLVAIILVAILTRLGEWLRGAKGEVRVKFLSEEFIDDRAKVVLLIAIDNTGRVVFKPKEVYWHVFLDPRVRVLWETLSTNETGIISKARTEPIFIDELAPYHHIQGIIDIPIFPGILYEVASVTVDVDRRYPFHARYFMGTVHGTFPRRPWRGRVYLWLRHILFKERKAGWYHGEIKFG